MRSPAADLSPAVDVAAAASTVAGLAHRAASVANAERRTRDAAMEVVSASLQEVAALRAAGAVGPWLLHEASGAEAAGAADPGEAWHEALRQTVRWGALQLLLGGQGPPVGGNE
jgi:hypothetical protein